MKAFNDLQNRGVCGGQQRIFEWINKSSGADSRELFASSADAEWEKEEAKNEAKTPELPTSSQANQ